MKFEIECSSAEQYGAILALIGERSHQDKKYGTLDTRSKGMGEYIILIRKLLRDAERAYCEENNDTQSLDELRKLAAVALACFEKHGVPQRVPHE